MVLNAVILEPNRNDQTTNRRTDGNTKKHKTHKQAAEIDHSSFPDGNITNLHRANILNLSRPLSLNPANDAIASRQ